MLCERREVMSGIGDPENRDIDWAGSSPACLRALPPGGELGP